MFALLSITQQNVDKMDDAIRIFETKVIPAAQIQKGFKGIYLLTDRKTGKTISLGLWNSKDDAIETERSGYYSSQMDEFKNLCKAPPVLEGYEISAQG
ncbi:MAG TPA: hypothetical protein VM123_08060 [archaeon]|nr:hypothetical protein [archaeon]